MSIYTKPVSQLETADLQELLSDGAVENVRLEFKLQVPDKEHTLKKLSSFANKFGGFMVIGAKEDGTDGRIVDLPGVDVVSGYKQKVVQWCFDGVSPPLNVEVSDPIQTPADNGKVCYVVYVAESDVAPHFLNGRKGIWIRTDELSARFEARLANESELRQLLDRRKLVRERRVDLLKRSRKRFDTHLGRMRTDASGHRTSALPSLEFCIVPRFPSQQVCQQQNLKGYLQENGINWRQTTFPNLSKPILSQHESIILLNPVLGLSFLEVNVWGMLFYGAELGVSHNQAVGIHLHQFVGMVLLFVRHAAKILEAMGYTGPVHIDTFLGSIRNVPWLYPMYSESYLDSRPGSELDSEIHFPISSSSEALCEEPDAVAMNVLRLVSDFSRNGTVDLGF